MSAHLGTQSGRPPPLSREETQARRGKGASEFCEDLVLPSFRVAARLLHPSIYPSTIPPSLSSFLPPTHPPIQPCLPCGAALLKAEGLHRLSLKVKEVGARPLLREWLA